LAGSYTPALPGCYVPAHKFLVKHFFFKRKISSTIAFYFEDIQTMEGAAPPRAPLCSTPLTVTYAYCEAEKTEIIKGVVHRSF